MFVVSCERVCCCYKILFEKCCLVVLVEKFVFWERGSVLFDNCIYCCFFERKQPLHCPNTNNYPKPILFNNAGLMFKLRVSTVVVVLLDCCCCCCYCCCCCLRSCCFVFWELCFCYVLMTCFKYLFWGLLIWGGCCLCVVCSCWLLFDNVLLLVEN